MLAAGDVGPLPTTPIELIGFIVAIFIVVVAPLVVRSRRRDDAPEVPPQLTQQVTTAVVDQGLGALERAMQAHIDSQASRIRQLELEVREQDEQIDEYRASEERLKNQVRRLKAAREAEENA